MTAERPRVVLALSPLAERHVEGLLFDADAPLELLASTLDADELLERVREHTPQAALVSPELAGLSAAHCERVRAAGARLVGLALDERERRALDALAVNAKIDSSVSREELLAAIHGGVGDARPARAVVPRTPVQRGENHGSLIAVIGGKGAPGASECAASLAALANQRWDAILVELDALGGGLALRLGADPGDGSILGLIRATQAGDGALAELIERWRCQRPGWPAVLLGPPDPDALAELAQPGVITHALGTLTGLYPLVVCDVGFLLADAEQPAARSHREALIGADAVLLVLGTREAQLRDGLRQLEVVLDTLAIPAERVRIIANGLGAPAGAAKDTLDATVAEHLGESAVTVNAWLDWDTRTARRAHRHGTPFALARRRSPYARELARLLDELFLLDHAGVGPKAKRRKRRLTPPRPGREQPSDDGQEVALPWQT